MTEIILDLDWRIDDDDTDDTDDTDLFLSSVVGKKDIIIYVYYISNKLNIINNTLLYPSFKKINTPTVITVIVIAVIDLQKILNLLTPTKRASRSE
jgi:hypothetical protein